MVMPRNIDPSLIPPEILAMMQRQGGGIAPPQGGMPPPPHNMPPGFVDGPSEDPALREQQFFQQQTQAIQDENMGFMDLQSPTAPGFALPDPSQGIPGRQGGDPVLDQLMAQIQQTGPVQEDLIKKKKGKVRKPKKEDIEAVAERDRMRWQATVQRFGEDVALFRQHDSAKPKSFKHDREQAITSSEFSILVNKLSNMFSGTTQVYEVPYDDMIEEKSAQIVEDALYHLRKRAKRTYGFNGANLQRDEFFYMFLYGRYVKRILPDLHDPEYPFRESLIDPATCYPTWGDEKEGLVRMVRKYTTTVGKVLSTYGEGIPDLEAKLAKKMGHDTLYSSSDYLHEEGEMLEYHDKWYYYASFKGEVVVPVTAHEFGRVPYVYVMPTGEPPSMTTPGGRYMQWNEDYKAHIPHIMTHDQDLSEKGVSVYHYLKNTHRVKEMLMTLLYNEVEKATDPATITYTAPHMMGQEPPPLDTKRRGNNQRVMNFQTVEGIPTSPRPTDFSPLFATVQDELVQGTLPPGAFGAEQGSNTTASGVTAMVQNAYDLINPYVEAWQNGQAQEAQIKLEMYTDLISKTITLSVPENDARGRGKGEMHDLSPFDIQAVGTYVDVKMAGLTLQNEAQQIAAMNQAVQAGFYSRRHAMDKLNVINPDKMFTEIIGEQAMQHPQMMENFIIPEGFAAQGLNDFAKLWMELVVAPKLMQGMNPGAAGQEGQPQPGQPAPEGTGSQQVPDPTQGMVPPSEGMM